MGPYSGEKKCCFCGESMESGLAFHNRNDKAAFIYMDTNQASHAECYIHKCVEIAFKKCKEEDTK